MIRLLFPVLATVLLLVAGCGRKSEEAAPNGTVTEEPVEAPAETAPAGDLTERQPVRKETSTGLKLEQTSFEPMSRNAMGITGAVTFKADLISFQMGQTITTRLYETVGAGLAYSAKGESWADLLYLSSENDIEIRQVVGVAVNDDAQKLCGDDPITWVGIGTDAVTSPDHVDTVAIALITGENAPSPSAAEDNVCSILTFTG